MKKIILHIGYHKTGTTFLNRKFFPAHQDVHHLGKPFDVDSPIREIIERVIGIKKYDADRCKKLYEKHIEPFRKDKIVTISDGRIVKCIVNDNLTEIPKRLMDITSEISVIIVIRQQYDYLKSLYVQKVGVDNEKKSFDEWFDSNWEDGAQLKKQLSYSDKIQAYVDILGEENVGVFLYEKFRNNGKGFLQDICKFIGLDCTTLYKEINNSKRLNQRMTTMHRLTKRYAMLNYISILIKKITPKNILGLIKKIIFKIFKSYDPELSEDRLKLVQEHARLVNNKLINEFDLDLYKYEH